MDRDKVLKLFRWFESKGCEMIVWSYGGMGMALDCIRGLELKAEPMSKVTSHFEDSENFVKIAVDDDMSGAEYLSADTVILVHEIDENADFDKVYGHLLI